MAEVVLRLSPFPQVHYVLLVLSWRHPTSHWWGKIHLFHTVQISRFYHLTSDTCSWGGCWICSMKKLSVQEDDDWLDKVNSTSTEMSFWRGAPYVANIQWTISFHCVNVLPFISFLSDTFNVCVVNNCLNHFAIKIKTEGINRWFHMECKINDPFCLGSFKFFYWQGRILPFSVLI